MPAARAAAGQRVRVETDLLRADIDLAGAVLDARGTAAVPRRAGLDRGRLPSWSPARSRTATPTSCCSKSAPNRVYVAQSGLVGAADLPTHRTPFVKLDGPTPARAGQDKLEVRSPPSPAGCA